jgi:hypothetical protein
VAIDEVRLEVPVPLAAFPHTTGDSDVNNGVDIVAAVEPSGSSTRSINAPPAMAPPPMAKVDAEKLQLIVAVAEMTV